MVRSFARCIRMAERRASAGIWIPSTSIGFSTNT
jgi:hypothetical protein